MTEQPTAPAEDGANQRDRRWRLVLGDPAAEQFAGLGGADLEMDGALAALYDADSTNRRGGLGASAPSVARWLGDIRKYFPSTVVQVMQHDAVTRLNLHALLTEPELIDSVEPDIDMVTTLIGLGRAIPESSKLPRGRWYARLSTRSRSGSPNAHAAPSVPRWTVPAACTARNCVTSTGTPRSRVTCTTICPSRRPSFPNASSGTGDAPRW